jgi:hypothetical protein
MIPDIDLPTNGALPAAAPERAPNDIANATRPRARVRKSDAADDVDAELAALRACAVAVGPLDDNARARVLLYLTRRYATPQTRVEVARAVARGARLDELQPNDPGDAGDSE